MTTIECAESGHAPNPVHVGGPGPLVSTCQCGDWTWTPQRTSPRFERTAPLPQEGRLEEIRKRWLEYPYNGLAKPNEDGAWLIGEIDRLMAGAAAEDPDPACEPTPAQAWRMLLSWPAEKRLERIASMMEQAHEAWSCRHSLHAQRIEELTETLLKVQAVRTELQAQSQAMLDLCNESDDASSVMLLRRAMRRVLVKPSHTRVLASDPDRIDSEEIWDHCEQCQQTWPCDAVRNGESE